MDPHGGRGGHPDNIDLPPGFRFHPTNEELITHYLSNKVTDSSFSSIVIGEVDLNKCEPWDLPRKAKMGEKEWYFFCVRDRKYPTGLRTNRATEAGYWKATGKDKDIFRAKSLVGMKKTLVFYRGRAPKGEKTDWVMHEYRLEGKYSVYNLPKTAKNEWVICRVFKKSSGGRKGMGLVRMGSALGEESGNLLPPLMEVSYTSNSNDKAKSCEPAHVTCFSNAMEDQKGHEDDLVASCFNSPFLSASSNNNNNFMFPIPASFYSSHSHSQGLGNMQFHGGSLVQLLEGNGYDKYGGGMKQSCKAEREMLSASQDTGLTTDLNPEISSNNIDMGRQSFDVQQEVPSTSASALHLDDSLWNY